MTEQREELLEAFWQATPLTGRSRENFQSPDFQIFCEDRSPKFWCIHHLAPGTCLNHRTKPNIFEGRIEAEEEAVGRQQVAPPPPETSGSAPSAPLAPLVHRSQRSGDSRV